VRAESLSPCVVEKECCEDTRLLASRRTRSRQRGCGSPRSEITRTCPIARRQWREIQSHKLPPIFAALERYAHDWHQSRLPQSMRDRGIAGIAVERIDPSGFRLKATGFELRFGANLGTTCVGDVVAVKDGSLLRFRVGFPTPASLIEEFAEILRRALASGPFDSHAT
jgi:hypothetical protein